MPPSFTQLSIGSVSVRPLSVPDGDPGSVSHIREIAHSHHENLPTQEESDGFAATSIPDDVLLEIFDFYRINHDYSLRLVWKWHILVHVCRRWRLLIFASPQRLKLQILCTHGTLVRKNLGIWPALPIVLDYHLLEVISPYDEASVIAVLEHPDRVCSITFSMTSSQLRKIATRMQKPFPALTLFNFVSWDLYGRGVPVLPAKFLGGSAPCLQEITLTGVPFPALGTLLLSARGLVKLDIRDIPPAGYISPEAMVACLATLPRLESITVGLYRATRHPYRILTPHVARTVLPALTDFRFKGTREYLENLVAQIDCPQLNRVDIQFECSDQLLFFHVPQFVDRSMRPGLTPVRCAELTICHSGVALTLHCHASYPGPDGRHAPVRTTISYETFEWHRVSHMAQVLGQFSVTLSNVVHLKLECDEPHWEHTHGVEWLDLLRLFSTVQTLYVSWTLARHVALALEDRNISAEMAAEVLPSTLDLICLEAEPPHPAPSIEKIVAVRQLSGHSITVVDTETEFIERLQSYITKY